ncbi:hypothetical protein BH11BAC7_BH11BAC7_35450 [soil metagenome]
MRYYYPLSTRDYVFENIFSSESVSPLNFYKKRGFGIHYFYKLPRLHNENALILYSAPPLYTIDKGNTDAVKFILEIDSSSLREEEIIELKGKEIIAYPQTIYLNRKNFRVLFFSTKDEFFIRLKSTNSLPTKDLNKFKNNFSVISEKDCKEFDLKITENASIVDRDSHTQILFDTKYNHFKGVVYGITLGVMSEKSPEEIQLKRCIQDITNAFAEVKNRFEDFRQNKTSNSKINFHEGNQLGKYKEKLDVAIKYLENLFNLLFLDQTASDEKIAEFLTTRFNDRFKTKEDGEGGTRIKCRYLLYS